MIERVLFHFNKHLILNPFLLQGFIAVSNSLLLDKVPDLKLLPRIVHNLHLKIWSLQVNNMHCTVTCLTRMHSKFYQKNYNMLLFLLLILISIVLPNIHSMTFYSSEYFQIWQWNTWIFLPYYKHFSKPFLLAVFSSVDQQNQSSSWDRKQQRKTCLSDWNRSGISGCHHRIWAQTENIVNFTGHIAWYEYFVCTVPV